MENPSFKKIFKSFGCKGRASSLASCWNSLSRLMVIRAEQNKQFLRSEENVLFWLLEEMARALSGGVFGWGVSHPSSLFSPPSSLLLGSYLVLAFWAVSGIDESFILFSWLPLNCTEAHFGGDPCSPSPITQKQVDSHSASFSLSAHFFSWYL